MSCSLLVKILYTSLEIKPMPSLLSAFLFDEPHFSHPRKTCMIVVICALILALLAKEKKLDSVEMVTNVAQT